MKRTGSWILIIAGVLALLGGAWLGLSPYLFRETATILVVRPAQEPAPYADAVEDGVRLAVEERDHRAGKFRIAVDVYPDNLFVFSSTPPAITAQHILERHPEVAAFVTAGPENGVTTTGDASKRDTAPIFSATDTYPRDASSSCTDGPPGYFRVLPDDPAQGWAAADWALRLGARTVYVLTEKHNHRSEIIATGFVNRSARLGLDRADMDWIDSLEPAIPENLIHLKPDLVFFAGEEPPYETAHAIGTLLKKAGYSGKLMIADAWPTLSYLVVPGRVVEGTYLVSPFPPVPDAFRERFRKRFNRRAGPHNYSGYLAARAALDAIEKANVSKPGAVRAACAELPQFDRFGDTAETAPSGYVLRNGEFEFVEPLE